jgi:hypothetical protein
MGKIHKPSNSEVLLFIYPSELNPLQGLCSIKAVGIKTEKRDLYITNFNNEENKM